MSAVKYADNFQNSVKDPANITIVKRGNNIIKLPELLRSYVLFKIEF